MHMQSISFTVEGNGVAGVRQRKQTSEEDLDSVLKHHNEVQTKLAEEMVLLARNMKENAKAANRIIKDDNKVSIFLRAKHFYPPHTVSYMKKECP